RSPSWFQGARSACDGRVRSLVFRRRYATSDGYRTARPVRTHAASGRGQLDLHSASASLAQPIITSVSVALSGSEISDGVRYSLMAPSIPALASSPESPAEVHPGSSGQTAE